MMYLACIISQINGFSKITKTRTRVYLERLEQSRYFLASKVDLNTRAYGLSQRIKGPFLNAWNKDRPHALIINM